MAAPEAYQSSDRAIPILEDLALKNHFDNFLPYALLAEASSETNTSTINWPDLLEVWEQRYDPLTTLARYNRGNCINFAASAQAALLAHAGIRTAIIGKRPRPGWSQAQKQFIDIEHVALLAAGDDPVLYEPGWQVGRPIPLTPEHQAINVAGWTFKTTGLDTRSLRQEVTGTNKHMYERQFDLTPFSIESLAILMRRLLRIPRNMELATLTPDTPHVSIRYVAKDDVFDSNIPGLPSGTFTLREIGPGMSKKLETTFGFDVKEELVASLAIRRTVPWVR